VQCQLNDRASAQQPCMWTQKEQAYKHTTKPYQPPIPALLQSRCCCYVVFSLQTCSMTPQVRVTVLPSEKVQGLNLVLCPVKAVQWVGVGVAVFVAAALLLLAICSSCCVLRMHIRDMCGLVTVHSSRAPVQLSWLPTCMSVLCVVTLLKASHETVTHLCHPQHHSTAPAQSTQRVSGGQQTAQQITQTCCHKPTTPHQLLLLLLLLCPSCTSCACASLGAGRRLDASVGGGTVALLLA
jgi:hypothetical protein